MERIRRKRNREKEWYYSKTPLPRTPKRNEKLVWGGIRVGVEREFSVFLHSFYQKRIKAMLIRGECKFLFK